MLLTCSQCKLWRYCSADHQKQHWSTHKPECRRLAAELAARVEPELQSASQLALPAPPSKSTAPACGFCGATKEKLLMCGKCKVMRYCNTNHQKQHWAVHKSVCVAPAPAQPKALLSAEQISRQKSIEAAIKSLQSNRHDGPRILSALDVLSLLVINDHKDSCRYFAQLGGVELLLGVLRQHLKNAKICAVGLGIVAYLAYLDDVGSTIMARGGLAVLFSALRDHSKNADVNASCCWVLANLASNENNIEPIVAGGGLEMIITALRNHPTNTDINANGCWALACLAEDADNTVAIVARGGLKLIIAALRNHPTHAGVNDDACWDLAYLAENIDIQAAIVARGGLDVLFTALQNHLMHIGINQGVCRALVNLAQYQRFAIEQHGGVAVVHAVLSRFPGNEVIQDQGRRFLNFLNHK